MTPIVEAHGLTKCYGRGPKEVRALDGLDLVAEPGRVVALLGPNGAGKTTFVRALATLVRPDGGALRVDGIDVVRHPRRVRRLIGLAGQYAAVEPTMSGRENLEMTGRLFGLDRAAARHGASRVLAQLHLEEAADRLVRTYSGGMRRRLDLGASLVGSPRLLLLDEPTSGVSAEEKFPLMDTVMAAIGHDSTCVLFVEHDMEVVGRYASRVVAFYAGRIVADGAPGAALATDDVRRYVTGELLAEV
jgi:ABC-type multidrug transport system ATPase subunit